MIFICTYTRSKRKRGSESNQWKKKIIIKYIKTQSYKWNFYKPRIHRMYVITVEPVNNGISRWNFSFYYWEEFYFIQVLLLTGLTVLSQFVWPTSSNNSNRCFNHKQHSSVCHPPPVHNLEWETVDFIFFFSIRIVADQNIGLSANGHLSIQICFVRLTQCGQSMCTYTISKMDKCDRFLLPVREIEAICCCHCCPFFFFHFFRWSIRLCPLNWNEISRFVFTSFNFNAFSSLKRVKF